MGLSPEDLSSAQAGLDTQLELCLHKLYDMKIHKLLKGGGKNTMFNKNLFLQKDNSLTAQYIQGAMLAECLSVVVRSFVIRGADSFAYYKNFNEKLQRFLLL